MGLFERFGRWVDRGLAHVGRAIAGIGVRIEDVGVRVEKRFMLEPEKVRKRTWRDKAIEAIEDEDIDPGMTDEEVREKYKNNE